MNGTGWLDYEFLGNPVLTLLTSAGLFIASWVALVLFRRVLISRVHALAEGTPIVALRIAEHVVKRTQGWFLLLVALFIARGPLDVPPGADTLFGQIVMAAVLLQIALWASEALVRFLKIRREHELEDNPGAVAAMDVLSFVARVAVWSILLLVLLDNLGVDITTLVAGLGVGGIAMALAAQNILGDLFASLSIVLDKPFVVGDFMIVDDYLGSVEQVGIKTTRVRSLSGEQLIFSNNDLLNSRIRNYGRMMERRVVFSLGVTYQTSPDKLKRIPDIIREAVEAQDEVRFDRAHFQKYGDFALIFEVVYYVLMADYNRYMDIQQAINLSIFERFANEGIEFAYPTQTLYVANEGGRDRVERSTLR
jgi:small-conductance mechanosensitive channel